MDLEPNFSGLAPEGQAPHLTTKPVPGTTACVLRCRGCGRKCYGNLALLDVMINASEAAEAATGVPHVPIPSCRHCGARRALFPEEVCGVPMEVLAGMGDEAGAALVARSAVALGLMQAPTHD